MRYERRNSKCLNVLLVFVGNVTAIQDAWFVGDEFLRQSFDTYTNLRTGSKIERKRPPYLFEMYNVLGYYQSIRSMVPDLARVLNSLIEGLNKRLRLPKYVIISLDKDLMSLLRGRPEFGMFEILKTTLKWLVKQISTLIQRKRIDLFDKKPGTLAKDPPKIVWVKMLRRPAEPRFQQICSFRGKFNKALEAVLFDSSYKDHYILTINAEPADFVATGDLNGIGKITYWKEVDLCMRKFDKGEINLRPRPPIVMERVSVVDKARQPKNAMARLRQQQNKKRQQQMRY